MSADRRFMLLLACALVAIVAVGAGFGRAPNDDARAAPSDALRADTARTIVQSSDGPPVTARPLAALASTHIRARFSSPALSLSSATTQIVSYYGSPYTSDMGILGTGSPEAVADLLEEHAARYDDLNGPLDVIPAIHFVYAVAQRDPTRNGLYLQYAAAEDLREYIELTAKRGMLLFIDLQIGRSSVEDEIEKVLPYLRYPHVHLALDPEFAVSSPEVPGLDLGSLSGRDLENAQRTLRRLVQIEALPRKLLIVHQFIDSMVEDGDAIGRYPEVELIVDMDGFGEARIKRVKYERYASRPYAHRAAIKLFFLHDPDLMSEEDVLSLDPRPAVIIYQ